MGFTGKVSQIADVHQHGLRDRPSLRAKAVSYPKRELLGATMADRDRLLDTLYEHLASA
nr:phage virion morphogenesis protein [Novosphingobium guangzhouense]